MEIERQFSQDQICINTEAYREKNGYILKIINKQGDILFETKIDRKEYLVDLASFNYKYYFLQLMDNMGNIIGTHKIKMN